MKNKLRYLAYNFEMPTFERKGHLYLPAFEHGRIIVQEHQDRKTRNHALLGIMERPEDEEAENYDIFRYGYATAIDHTSLGRLDLTKHTRNAWFTIDVKPKERSKGYGTVLMSAAAKNCRDSGIETIQGGFSTSDDWERRMEFYERLGMPVKMYQKVELQSSVNNQLLNTIAFEEDLEATEILNSIPALQYSLG